MKLPIVVGNPVSRKLYRGGGGRPEIHREPSIRRYESVAV